MCINNIGRRCPICNSNNNELLYVHQLNLVELLNFMPKVLNIVCCEKCGMIYTSSEADQDTYIRYYDTIHAYTDDKNTHNSEEDKFSLELREKEYSIISKYIDTTWNIVDVGTGTGGLLQTFRNHGYQYLTGIDIDNKEEMLLRKGIKFYQGDINSLPNLKIENRNDKHSLFILSGVLEHIFDVSEAMNSLKIAMKMDDYVFIMVPDADGYFSYFDKPYRYFGMEHINHFNERTLDMLLEQHGLEVETQGKFDYRLNDINTDPAIYVIAKKKNIAKDVRGREYIVSYINKSEEYDVKVIDKIESLVCNGKNIIIWGIGSYFMSLCENTPILNCNIEFLVDNNKTLQGTSVKGIEIKNPTEIINHPESCICVVSAAYSENILQEIKELELLNEVVVI